MRRSSGTGSVAWPPAEPAAATRPRNGALPRRPVTFPRAVQIIEKGRRQLPSRGGSTCPRLAPLTRAQPDSAGRELRSAAPVRARTEQEKRRTGERCRNEGLVDRVASAAREQT
ncbi:unnamed protein product [Prorocentrum cordatum]|uniref:Uncharacterized protein n=1 Tax=Prorocentrum cordatum TaxID=2364126 RepID=A0ABN9XFW2_9DINO|nr:unnamed protein product [Polarella glacialis]